jgi:uncharacterized phage protein (TIGR02218 family)
MKTIPIYLLDHYQARVQTRAVNWRIVLTDGRVVCLTSHDRPVQLAGEVYIPGAFDPTAIRSTADLDVDNSEMQGVIGLPFERDEVMAGIVDNAQVWIMRLNWTRPQDGAEIIHRGEIGTVSVDDGALRAELRGLAWKIQQARGRTFGPMCAWNLGEQNDFEPGCPVNIADYTVTGTVETSDARDTFYDIARNDGIDGRFTDGYLRWTGGANAGVKVAVKSVEGGNVILQELGWNDIQPGDTYSMTWGCLKDRPSCKRYGAIKSFGGCPDMPGRDEMQSPTINSTEEAAST